MQNITGGRTDQADAALSRHEAVVLMAEAHWRARPGLPVSDVCRMLGLSERGLRNAFYDIRGMSPKRCMLAERLQEVHRALREASTTRATVTAVATDHGFHELGRFASIYRQAFGQTPSATLRGGIPRASSQHASS